VEQTPLQVYYSTLMFTLTNSVVKQQFYKLLTWVERAPQMEQEWNAGLWRGGEEVDFVAQRCVVLHGKFSFRCRYYIIGMLVLIDMLFRGFLLVTRS
jgi:hypothetical protein